MSKDTPLILVVDDDSQVREWMRTALEGEGYRVLEAGNGYQAFAWYLLLQPDLVVMDIYMPDKDGFESISLMRKHCLTAKILAISGNYHEKYDVGAMAKTLGAIERLSKPFSVNELLRHVETILKTG